MPRCSRLTAARVLHRHRHGALVPATSIDEGVGGDEHGARTAGGPDEQILRQRLERIADLARRLVERARVNPQAPAFGLVGELVRIVDDAEG